MPHPPNGTPLFVAVFSPPLECEQFCPISQVGGPGFSTVIKQMNPRGRVAVCGAIASYNESSPAKCK